jgi:hypothetical protein
MLFSLPKGMDGNGVICPGCEHLLTIPSAEDSVSELGVSGDKYHRVKAKKVGHNVLEHQRSPKLGEHHEWADSPQEHGDKGLKIMIPIVAVSLLLISGLAYILLVGNNVNPNDSAQVFVDPILNGGSSSETKLIDAGDDAQAMYVYDNENSHQVMQLNDFLVGMFAAKTVDDLLKYVQPVQNIREKMIKFYKGQALSQSPFNELTYAQNIPNYPEYLTFRGQTQDYNNHVGVLKYAKDEILLDWESFVAYSDMSWHELADKKPTEPVRVRVTAKRAFYYNEEFTNEAKWQAVSLISPNEGDAIYGYVLRGSAAQQRLFNFGLSDDRRVTLDVYFPEGAKRGNQVFIGRVVEQGWLVEEEN